MDPSTRPSKARAIPSVTTSVTHGAGRRPGGSGSAGTSNSRRGSSNSIRGGRRMPIVDDPQWSASEVATVQLVPAISNTSPGRRAAQRSTISPLTVIGPSSGRHDTTTVGSPGRGRALALDTVTTQCRGAAPTTHMSTPGPQPRTVSTSRSGCDQPRSRSRPMIRGPASSTGRGDPGRRVSCTVDPSNHRSVVVSVGDMLPLVSRQGPGGSPRHPTNSSTSSSAP